MKALAKIASHELNTVSENSTDNIKEPLLIVPKKGGESKTYEQVNTLEMEKRPASTVLEKRVLAYLSEVFNFPIENLLDNFLELGGGSLKAAQLINHLKQNGYKASMEDIFNSKNLAAFVAKVEYEEVSI
ncbi:MAG: phosphopantetheine-binding protein [Defluviitaleaceae bacterium]|nr:phosphopantetheine-binding protein [Defluviitaleaceae bacterium]